MARIRSIKPEFPQSETVGRLSRDSRLLFIQIWTIADDHGRAKAAPKLLASLLYPYDDDAIKLMPKWLRELEQNGCIRLYEVEGNRYLDIPNWGKHQRIDNAGKSNIPEFLGDSPQVSANDGDSPLDLGPRKGEDLGTLSRKARENEWPEDFEERFWAIYPRRVGKQAALKKLRNIHKTDRVSWHVVEAAARLYAKECEDKELQYVAHPLTWLNGGRYEDELPAGTKVFDAAPSAEYVVHQQKIAIKDELHKSTGRWPAVDEIERIYAERHAA